MPVVASAATKGRATRTNARSRLREPVAHGARHADAAPARAMIAAKTAATRGLKFASAGEGGPSTRMSRVRSGSRFPSRSVERNERVWSPIARSKPTA